MEQYEQIRNQQISQNINKYSTNKNKYQQI